MKNFFKKIFVYVYNKKIIPKKIDCICEKPPISYENYISCRIGTDLTSGRYADVEILSCIHCKRKWINYFFEIEAFSQSGRWYRGLLQENKIMIITPENSIEYIKKLTWHIYGGSYFRTSGRIGENDISLN